MSGYGPEFLKIATAHWLAMASPGPDFAIVLSQSFVYGRRTAVWTALGIATAITLPVGYSLFGLGIVLKSSPAAFTVIKFAGAAYLAWLGLKSLAAKRPTQPIDSENRQSIAEAGADAGSAWRTGFFTNALNPKAALFFVAFFATIVSPLTPVHVRLLYGTWIILSTAGWFCFVAYVFTQKAVRDTFLSFGPWIDRAMGVLFIAFALLLLRTSLHR